LSPSGAKTVKQSANPQADETNSCSAVPVLQLFIGAPIGPI
jgi:hypothetical protein